MCVCEHVSTFLCMYMCVCVCACVHVCVFVCVWAHLCVCERVNMFLSMHVCVGACVCVCVCVCVFVCLRMLAHTCLYMPVCTMSTLMQVPNLTAFRHCFQGMELSNCGICETSVSPCKKQKVSSTCSACKSSDSHARTHAHTHTCTHTHTQTHFTDWWGEGQSCFTEIF